MGTQPPNDDLDEVFPPLPRNWPELRFPMGLVKAGMLIGVPPVVLGDTFMGLLWRSRAAEGNYEVEDMELLLTFAVVVRILRTIGADLRAGRAYGVPDAFAARELLDRIRESWQAATGLPTVKDGLAITAGQVPMHADPLPLKALVAVNLDEIAAELAARARVFEHRAYGSLVAGGLRGHLEAILLMGNEVREVLAGLPTGIDDTLEHEDLPDHLKNALVGRVDTAIDLLKTSLHWLTYIENEHPDLLDGDG